MSEELNIEELKAKADSLGVKYSPNIGADTLAKRIAEKEAELAAEAGEDTPVVTSAPTPDATLTAESVLNPSERIPPVQAEVSALKEEDNRRLPINAKLRQEALKLHRVIITCLDPMYKDYSSQMFQVGNRVVGTIKKTIPFGVEFHVPQILLNQIESETFVKHSRVSGSERSNGGMGEMERTIVPRYGIRYLEPLTPKELEDLKATLRAQK